MNLVEKEQSEMMFVKSAGRVHTPCLCITTRASSPLAAAHITCGSGITSVITRYFLLFSSSYFTLQTLSLNE